MDQKLRLRVERVTGSAVVRARQVQGGYSPAERWCAELTEGKTVFVKLGTTPHTAACLRDEYANYSGRCRLDSRRWAPRCRSRSPIRAWVGRKSRVRPSRF